MKFGFALAVAALLLIGLLTLANTEETPLPPGAIADKVVVEKSARKLTLFSHGTILKQYEVALGKQPVGDKSVEGDQRTPEGLYAVDRRNPKSPYHLSLHVSYPDAAHIENAKRLGLSAGGDIMIHGLPRGLGWLGKLQRRINWTAGCVAVTNREIEEIWQAVPDNTPIEINP